MPAGKHAYDTRESDMGGEIGTIERGTVSVNFGGVFICDEEIDFGEDDYIDVSDEDGDWSFSFE
jgi:hypothetical protein